jgi:hypothetical protein
MSATSRLKQLLFIAAALALVSLGLVAAFSPASPARADDTQPCVETQDSYSDWVNEGDQIRTEENNAPGTDGDLVRYVFVGETEPEVITPGVAGGHYSWNGGNRGVTNPPTVTPPHDDWQLNTDGEPAGHLNGATWSGTPGVGLHVLGNSPSNASWFYTVASVPEVTDTDFLWQKQTRTFTEGVDCPDPGPDCEANPQAEGCPPVDEGKKIVVCKYVGTPPGVLDHIVIVSENTLNNLVDDNGNPFSGLFPFSWTDAQGQTTEGSVAIRYAEEGEQAQDVDLAECGGEEEPELCPEGTDHAGEEVPAGGIEECDDEVDPGPETCPEGTDKAGQEIPADKTEEEFCDEDDEEDVCPEGSDHAGEEVPAGGIEECDDDDVNPGPDCEEDPTQKKCDEDNPPVVVPDDGNSPSNGPTVKGASATAPTAVAGQAAGTPAAQVPTAVNAGLGSTQQELAGNGGTLGLLGIATALLGAALVGLTVRPKRRIGAAHHART